jgi:flagellum-specific ATP synthase
MLATSMAEYFRARGARAAHHGFADPRGPCRARDRPAAGRTRRGAGYPPSALATITKLVERAGNSARSGGSITGLYTVLADGDAQDDPVVDTARSILDGHIVLSRDLAQRGQYPAIDIAASLSRVMTDITSSDHERPPAPSARWSPPMRPTATWC